MRFRVIKVIIAVFVVLFCFGLVLGAKYYVKTVQSFKTFYNVSFLGINLSDIFLGIVFLGLIVFLFRKFFGMFFHL